MARQAGRAGCRALINNVGRNEEHPDGKYICKKQQIPQPANKGPRHYIDSKAAHDLTPVLLMFHQTISAHKKGRIKHYRLHRFVMLQFIQIIDVRDLHL